MLSKLRTREMYVDGKPVQYLRKDEVMAALAQVQRVPMTVEEINRAWRFANTPCEANSWMTGHVTFARAIEEHHEIEHA